METKTTLLVAVFFVLLVSFSLSFLISKLTNRIDITAEISKLNPDETTLAAIKSQKCSGLVKDDEYWTVNGCENDIYFKLFLQDDGYYLGYCTPWSTPREAVLKLKGLIGDCVDLSSADKDVTQPGLKKAGLIKYLVCGREFVFRGECIVGV